MVEYPHARAFKILTDHFWTLQGWRRKEDRHISNEDFEYAKAKGMMFDPVYLTHDETVEQASTAVRAIKKSDVVDAFVASLSTRRLDIRSALGSYAVLMNLEAHLVEGIHNGYVLRADNSIAWWI